MIILLSKNNKVIRKVKKYSENVLVANNVLNLQIVLSEKDMECDILMLDWRLLQEDYTIFSNWLIEKNFFIKSILIYNTDEKCNIDKLIGARYNASIVELTTILQAMKGEEI